jgi:hypothetical protein
MICSNLQCFVRKDTVLSPHDLAFQLIKRKKNYKAKFSTNLILKKKTNKDNFGRKKTHEKKCCSNPQCFVRKTITFSLYDLVLL